MSPHILFGMLNGEHSSFPVLKIASETSEYEMYLGHSLDRSASVPQSLAPVILHCREDLPSSQTHSLSGNYCPLSEDPFD